MFAIFNFTGIEGSEISTRSVLLNCFNCIMSLFMAISRWFLGVSCSQAIK